MKKTKNMAYTREKVEKAVKAKGYAWFDSGKDFQLNIVGIRNKTSWNKVTNVFDDTLFVAYKENGLWRIHEWEFTTDPGKKSVLEFSNPKGVALLVPNQYLNTYIIGLHQGKYKALRQAKPVKVFRDRNKNMLFDQNNIDEGLFGINIHKAGNNSTYVENWSAGCQVFKRSAEFEEFMAICYKAAAAGVKQFTYTLLESTDFK